MKKSLARLTCLLFLLAVSVNGIAQSKNRSKNKPAADSTKPAKHAEEEEIKIGTLPDDEKPPEVEKLEDTKIGRTPPPLPPLPEIDTIPAPNDELTKEIKKMIVVTNGMGTSETLMKGALESQRKSNTSLADEFYVRMLQAVENGQISGYITNVIVKIYRQKFTVEEIREIIKFYDSPIGKKMAAESAPIANAARIEGEKVGQYMAIKIIEGLIKEGKWK
jgi:hypothetical protein